jgi:hypothetical protein
MPQFDTFSFFSQLFWVFFCFTLLYLSLCYYLLPGLAIILKVRKHKLTNPLSSTSTTTSISDNSFLQALSASLIREDWLTLQTSKTVVQCDEISASLLENEVLKTLSLKLSQRFTIVTLS